MSTGEDVSFKKNVYLDEGFKMVDRINTILNNKGDLSFGETDLRSLLQGTLSITYSHLIEKVGDNLRLIKQTKEDRLKITEEIVIKGNALNRNNQKDEGETYILQAKVYFDSYKELRNLLEDYNTLIVKGDSIIEHGDGYEILETLEGIIKIDLELNPYESADESDQSMELFDFLEDTLYTTYEVLIDNNIKSFVDKLKSEKEALVLEKINMHFKAADLYYEHRDDEANEIQESAEKLDSVVREFDGIGSLYDEIQEKLSLT